MQKTFVLSEMSQKRRKTAKHLWQINFELFPIQANFILILIGTVTIPHSSHGASAYSGTFVSYKSMRLENIN